MQILGIHIDKPFIRVALIEKSRRRCEILYVKSLLLDDPENVKQLYTHSFSGKICSALSAKNLLLRHLEIKTSSHRHMEQIIAFQSEATMHFNASDILTIPYIAKKRKDKTDLILFTTPREAIQEHLSELKKYKLDPDCITATPLALIRYAKWKNPNLLDAFIVDLGSEEWTCVCMENGDLKKFHFVDGGIDALLTALWEDRKKILFQKEIKGIAKQIDLLQLKSNLNVQLSEKLMVMKLDLAKLIYSFSSQYGPKPILFTGRIDAFGQMREYLLEAIKESVSDEIQEISKEEEKYAIPIGLGLEYGPTSLQFRKGEFFPRKNWKQAGIYSLYLMLASLFLSGSLIGSTNYIVNMRKQEMVSFLRTSINQWDSSLIPMIFSDGNEEEILQRWNKVVSSNAKKFPYFMQSPKVSEILSWLYQLPILTEIQSEKDPIEIKFFRYQLVQCPKIDTPRDPYQAKIEIEFKTKSALNARKFHDHLLQNEVIVDTSQDIQWEALEGMYRVSFFIKKENKHAF